MKVNLFRKKFQLMNLLNSAKKKDLFLDQVIFMEVMLDFGIMVL